MILIIIYEILRSEFLMRWATVDFVAAKSCLVLPPTFCLSLSECEKIDSQLEETFLGNFCVCGRCA
jgi:hypothetical protein